MGAGLRGGRQWAGSGHAASTPAPAPRARLARPPHAPNHPAPARLAARVERHDFGPLVALLGEFDALGFVRLRAGRGGAGRAAGVGRVLRGTLQPIARTARHPDAGRRSGPGLGRARRVRPLFRFFFVPPECAPPPSPPPKAAQWLLQAEP